MLWERWTTFFDKKDSNYLHVKPKVSRRDGNRVFRSVQNITMEEAQFNEFKRLRNYSLQQKNLRKLVRIVQTNNVQKHGWTNQTGSKVVDVVARPNGTNCVTLQGHNVDRP